MPIGAIGMLAAGTAAGVIGDWIGNQTQYDQQKRLQELGVKDQMKLGRFNQQLAMETWEKTNYLAQREQMEKAGLNVGLMYGGQGHGGTTAGGQAGGISSGQAQKGMGIQAGLALALQQAQVENMNADTKLKEAEAAKKAGVDTAQAETQIKLLEEQTKGTALENVGKEFTNKLLDIQTRLQSESMETQVEQLKKNLELTVENIGTARAQNKVESGTADERIKQAKVATLQMGLQNALLKAQIKTEGLTQQEISAKMMKISEEIYNMQELRNLKGKEIELQGKSLENEIVKTTLDKIRTEFGTGTTAEMIRQVQTLTPLINALSAASAR